MVRLPAGLDVDEERYWVDKVTTKALGGRSADDAAIADRARRLSSTYGLPRASSISFVTNQTAQWGSCTPSTGKIRLSSRLSKMPKWVVDYVIVHELCHLSEPNHGPAFWALVGRYPLAERARGYLMAAGAGADLDAPDHISPTLGDG